MSATGWMLAVLAVAVITVWAARHDLRDDHPLVQDIRERRNADTHHEAPRRAARPESPDDPPNRPHRVRAGRPARDPLVEPSPALPGIPSGWTMHEYVNDGLARLQIMLSQHRRDH